MKRKTTSMQIILSLGLLLISLFFTGCDMDTLLNRESNYTLTLRNQTDGDAKVYMLSEYVTIGAWDERTFSWKATNQTYDIIIANGRYLVNYSKRIPLTKNGVNTHNIQPNAGYFGISNRTGKAITELKYGGQNFVYSEEMEYVGGDIENGETRYFMYLWYSNPDSIITFRFADDTTTTYKILSLPAKTTYGQTYTVDLKNDTEKEVISY